MEAAQRLLFSQRLRIAVQAAGGLFKVSQSSRVPKRTLGNYMDGTSDPKAYTLQAIARATGKSVDWLLGGDPAEALARSLLGADAKDGAISLPDFALIPRYDVRASAGPGAVVTAEEITEHLAFKRDWLARLGLNPQFAGLANSDGDSMEPTIPNGALILLDLSIKDVANGHIYAIRRDDELLVKRIQIRLDGTVVLIPDNPLYEREEVAPEVAAQLHIVGRVVWIGYSLIK